MTSPTLIKTTILLLILWITPHSLMAQPSPYEPVINTSGNWVILNETDRSLTFLYPNGHPTNNRPLTSEQYTILFANWPHALNTIGIPIRSTPNSTANLFTELGSNTPSLNIRFGAFYTPQIHAGTQYLTNQTIRSLLTISADTVEIGPQVTVEPGGHLYISANTNIYIHPGFHAKRGTEIILRK